MVEAILHAINATRWLSNWVCYFTRKELTIMEKSSNGTIGRVTIVPLDCQSFFLIDKIRGQLEAANL